MYGRIYSKHPDILLESFSGMKKEYKAKLQRKESSLFMKLQALYIRIFGIPEIGFQIRSMYCRKMLKLIKIPKNSELLDAGSGIGSYSFLMSDWYPEANIIGQDLDKRKVDFCNSFRKELGITNARFEKSDLTQTPKKGGFFNLIVNIDVLEHINDYKKVLSNFNKELANGGYLYIHMPQPNQKRIFKVSRSWLHEDHVREGISIGLFREDLIKAGFTVLALKPTHGFLGSLAWEINHIALAKSFILGGILYPFLYILARVDTIFDHPDGLCFAVLARKVR